MSKRQIIAYMRTDFLYMRFLVWPIKHLDTGRWVNDEQYFHWCWTRELLNPHGILIGNEILKIPVENEATHNPGDIKWSTLASE